MDNENKQPYISDASQPSAGRIYDYLLGGNHNFEIDRKSAEQLLKIAPFLLDMARLVRWFLGKAIRNSIKAGFTQFLDFASGLPTVDHIHSIAPKGTKVIYSDIDPITVEYGKEIIGKNDIVTYELCNAGTPEILLNSKIVKSLFKDDHKCAIGFNGICYFLTDEQISHAMNILYDWSDDGSILFLTDYDSSSKTNAFQSIYDLYKNMQQQTYIRTKKELLDLLSPWKLTDPGFLPLEEWIQLTPTVTDETIKTLGGGGFFGGFLSK